MEFDPVKHYANLLNENKELPQPIAVVYTMLEHIKTVQATTLSEFLVSTKQACDKLISENQTSIACHAGCQLFLQQLSIKSQYGVKNFTDFKQELLNSTNEFVQKSIECRELISYAGRECIRDNMVILVHSYSRVVMSVLKEAARFRSKRFSVYVTESRPDSSGYKTARELAALGIPCQVILDSAVGFIIEKVDIVLVGAEVVVENGGLINKIGTYQMAIIAKAHNKPVYALVESYKFHRLYPLNQYDFPTTFKNTMDSSIYQQSSICNCGSDDDDNDNGNDSDADADVHDHSSEKAIESKIDYEKLLESNSANVDYTPPQYVTYLITDLGIFTPNAVGDELIKFYVL